MIYLFELQQPTDAFVVNEPFAVFRFLEHQKNRTRCSEAVDDPICDAFFVVLGEIGNNEWVVYYNDAPTVPEELRGCYYIATWIGRPLNFRGHTFIDAGYFFCPYVPLIRTPVVMDPTTFNPRQGILTRYGKKLLADASKYYGIVH